MPAVTAGAARSRVDACCPQAKQRKAEIRARQKRRVKEQQRRAAEERLHLEEQIRAAEAEANAREASVDAMQEQYEDELRRARQEAADLQGEFERERAELLDTIREQNREQALIMQALSQFASPPEQSKVGQDPCLGNPCRPHPLAPSSVQMWERSSFNEATEDWTVPLLQLRADYRAPGKSGSKSMRLPTLGRTTTPTDAPSAAESVGRAEPEKEDVSELDDSVLEKQRRKLRKRLRKIDRELLRRRAGSGEGLTEWTTPRTSSPGEDADSVGTDDAVRVLPPPSLALAREADTPLQITSKGSGHGGEGRRAPRPPRPSDSARPVTRRRRSGSRKPKSAKQVLTMALATAE